MSGLFRLTGLVFMLCLSSVTGIRFDKTFNEVDLGADSQEEPNFWLNCTVESLSNEAVSVFLIKIQRASSEGHSWETIASVAGNEPTSEPSAPSYWRRPELLQGFLYTNESRMQSYLYVGVRVSDLTCVDSRMYNCEVGYVRSTPVGSFTESQNTSLTMTAGGSGGNTDTLVDNAGSSSAGAIAGGVVGGLVAIVIVAVLVYFFWYRRRSTGDDYKTKEEYGSENPNMAPTNNELYATPNKPKKHKRGSGGEDDDSEELKPKPKPRAPRQELHYAELDLSTHPPKAPRRKYQDAPVEYAEVEFKKECPV